MDVILHQNFIPHYRKKLFELLCDAGDLKFMIASDIKADSVGISVADPQLCSLRWTWCQTRRFRNGISWHPSLLNVVRNSRPAAVIAMGNPYVLTSWVLLLWGRITNTPIVLWTHGLLGPEQGLKGFVRLSFYRLASALLLYGDHAKALLADAGLPPRGMFVIYNSIDFEEQQRNVNQISKTEIDAFRSKVGVKDEERLIIFSGRLQENKKLSFLLDAADILHRRGRNVHIAFIGDGEGKTALSDQAKRLGIAPCVHFLGESYDERFIAKVFMASDLSVIPSGAGLSVMHALGYGVPVLLHDRPEKHFPEWEAVREGETGFFYRYGDINDMADKIENALFPTSQKERMRDACLGMIRDRYNTAAHAGAIISAINQIVEQKR